MNHDGRMVLQDRGDDGESPLGGVAKEGGSACSGTQGIASGKVRCGEPAIVVVSSLLDPPFCMWLEEFSLVCYCW